MGSVCKRTLFLNFMIIAMLSVLLACGGGGGSGSSSGGGDVQALSLPTRIELTNVDEGTTVSRQSMFRTAASFSDSGTDYSSQEKHSWVDDTDALDMINDILGIVKDTGYKNFVNMGAYKALVRQVGESKQSQSGNNATSTTTEQLMEMYVEVTRASNSAPMIVKIWVEEEDGPGDKAMLIRGHFTVTRGVSAEYPYGVMTAHFRGTALDDDMEMFTMSMGVSAEGGNVVIETVEDSVEGGQYEFHSKVQVVANEDVSQGNAYVWESDTFPNWESNETETRTSEQVIAFNEDYFKVTQEGTESFFSKANLRHRVFNYKMFNAADGSKVDLSSGFPIETADGEHGYVGYYGIWGPYGSEIAHGDTVTDMDGNDYTVYRSRGKLTKHTKASILLGELNGVELSKWDCAGDQCQDLIITWNGSDFIKLGARNQNNGMIEYYESTDAQYQATVSMNEWDGAWCEGLRAYLRLGSLFIDNNGDPTTPTDASTVFFHAEQTLDPASAEDMTLYTWEFTLGLPIDQTVVDGADSAMNAYRSGAPTEKTFKFVASEMILKDATQTNDVILPNGLNLSNSNLQWGYHIGPLTTSQSNSWDSHQATTYYSWNTGNDDWNQYATLKDSNGAFVSFEAPISFSYTHSTANDINSDSAYNGQVFRMEYDGFSVHIPWEFDTASGEWEPQININDGVLVGSSNQYVIKGSEESLLMEEVSDPGVPFPSNTVGEPNLSYDGTKTAQVGAVPVSAELKVIKGDPIE